MDKAKQRIFKHASKTYYYSSLFFPKKIRDDIFTLYAFVRTADDFVDMQPQNRAGLLRFQNKYEAALKGKPSFDPVIDDFVSLALRKRFDPAWVHAFFDAMKTDLVKKKYFSDKETARYMYGSAEVIGLMIAAILDLPVKARPKAKKLGTAFQYINFLRDIEEDNGLGRQYLPESSLKKYGLKTLRFSDVQKNPQQFRAFIMDQLDTYDHWQKEAEKGFSYIPRSSRIAIKTASDMYAWTGEKIRKDPFVVYRKKVKPSVLRILLYTCKNALFP